MKKQIVLTLSLAMCTVILAGCASSPATSATATNSGLATAAQMMQQGQQIGAMAQTAQSSGLVDLLMQRVGVSQAQAQGGAGALFQLAKSQMQASAFSQLSQAVPGMSGLLQAAPALGQSSALGGLSAMTGGSGNTMMALASAFQQQGMSPSMIQQFIPVILEYVQGTSGNGMASSLSSVLLGQ